MNRNELINRAIHGELDAREMADFAAELKNDTILRKDYLETLATDHLLAGHFGKASPASSPAKSIFRFPAPSTIVLGLAAAIALLLAIQFTFFSEQPAPMVIHDSPIASDWLPGKIRNFSEGEGNIPLAPGINAVFTDSSSARLRDEKGNIDLLSGIGHFQVRNRENTPSFEVHVAGRILRDIGTDFTVVTDGENYAEVHVTTGSISITDPGTREIEIVHAGEAARWLGNLPVVSIPLNGDPTSLAQPVLTVLLEDDFDDPDGTELNGKPADQGGQLELRGRHGIASSESERRDI